MGLYFPEWRIPILDKGDNQIGDAFEYAEKAIHRLETLGVEIEQQK